MEDQVFGERRRRRRQAWRQHPDTAQKFIHTWEEAVQRINTSIDVGNRLREVRQAQGYSLRSLAEKSGLNVNTLCLIENNKTSPSVSTLQQLALALQVPITAFFETLEEPKSVVFQKAGKRPIARFQRGLLEDLGNGISLAGGQPLLVHLEPGADSGANPIVHTGQEFVYCLEGCLVYRIGDEKYLLESGDSLIFEAHIPHQWGNSGDSISRSILIICPSDAADPGAQKHFLAEDLTPQNIEI
ncbi:MAG: cupin domain-containing protein [Anaerolineales bacterium]